MAGTNELTPKARLLGAELREARHAAGLTVRALASSLNISHVSVSRYENGLRTPRTDEVARILATLGVTGNKYEEILEFARTAGERNIFARNPTGPRKHLIELAEFERSATSIVDVAPLVLPGLAQTAAYTRDIMRSFPLEEREIRVGLRKARQDVLHGTKLQNVELVIVERVLHDVFGGRKAMIDQLRHLRSLTELDVVTLRILPSHTGGWTPAHDGAFVLFNFATAPSIVHAEHLHASTFLYDSRDVTDYKNTVQELRELAWDEAASVEAVDEAIHELEAATR